MFLLAAAAFTFFFLGELNDLYHIHYIFKASFFIGCLLLLFSTIGMLIKKWTPLSPLIRIPSLILSLIFLLLLLLSLFGSFSKKDGYMKQENQRPVYKNKLYALSRHPGVLFLILGEFCLFAGFSLPLEYVCFVSLMDLLLAFFEDRKVFPAVLSGYKDYQKETPFLIPTVHSLSRCIRDYRGNCQ